jgi:hypothetical protein
MRRRRIGKRAKASTEKSINAKTERSSCSREAKTTAAEMAALMDNTDVSLFIPGNGLFVSIPKAPKRDETGYRPFTLDRGRGIRVVSEHGMHEEERRCEGPDRVSRGGGSEGAEDRCEGNEREEDE